MKPRCPSRRAAGAGDRASGLATPRRRGTALWALLLTLAADLLPPAPAPPTAAASAAGTAIASAAPAPPASASAAGMATRAAPAAAPGTSLAGGAALLLAQADDGERPSRRRRRRTSRAGKKEKPDAGTQAAAPSSGEPRTASFPGDAVLSLRDEAWHVTAGGGAVTLAISKGTFPPDRDTSLTVHAVAGGHSAPPVGNRPSTLPVAVVSAVYRIGFTARPAAPLLVRLRFDAAAPALRSDPRLATLVLLPTAGDPAAARPVGGRVDRVAGWVESPITEPGMYAVAVRRPEFADLRSHPAAPEAALLAARGLMAGFPDGNFRPASPFTRAQLARILAAAARQEGGAIPATAAPQEGRAIPATAAPQEGSAPAAAPRPSFADVPATAWFAPDVAVVKAAGLMLGQGDLFHPGAAVTRQELALVALRLAGIPPGPAPAVPPAGASGSTGTARTSAGAAPRPGSPGRAGAAPPAAVADAHLAASWAAGGLLTAVEAGFLATDARHRARPRDPATRAEAALAIARALERRGFFEISTVVTGRLGKVHIPATYYELRTGDGRTYVLEPGAPDVDAALRQALGGTLTVTGYVNPASPYKIRGTALRTVKLSGVVLASDAPPASPSAPASTRKRKKRPTVTDPGPGINILDLEDDGYPRYRRKKRVPPRPKTPAAPQPQSQATTQPKN